MYTYNMLLDDINYLSHSNVDTGIIGASECGRVIPYVHCGKKSSCNQIIITGGIHAREHISSLLVMRQAYETLKHQNEMQGGVYFVPMLNPDGNLLCTEGLASAPKHKHNFLLSLNKNNEDFSLWKANINGVDLNTNFDAKFGTGKMNVFTPSSENYVGKHALSESETRAICEFTLFVLPVATISYHAKGQELYWEFFQKGHIKERDEKFALYLNSFLNYLKVDGDLKSAGGYKDWCISKLNISAVTIELVNDKHSHPLVDDFLIESDFEKNKSLPIKALEYLSKFSC